MVPATELLYTENCVKLKKGDVVGTLHYIKFKGTLKSFLVNKQIYVYIVYI